MRIKVLLINFDADFAVHRFVDRLARTHNRRLAKKRVLWLIEHSTSYQLLCWFDSLVLRNPLLRKAPNRQVVKILSTNFQTQ